jgi:hypothetical protein
LRHVEPLAKSILEYRNTNPARIDRRIIKQIRIKLWRSLRLYDPLKGSSFSFVAKVISSTAASVVGECWQRNERLCQFDETTDSALVCDQVASNEAVSDIEARVRQVKTPCTDSYELAAQRWFVESFIDCGFHIRRHEASDAVMQVFGLDHSRSRELFDLTLIAIRRELLAGQRLKPISPRSLVQTRSAAIVKYVRFVSADEFTRLATLMRDVAPSIILTVNRHNVCAIRRGEPEATRANLLLVLHGSPDDRRLFS